MTSSTPVETPKLQRLNYANVAAYILNIGVTYGAGISGLFPTNAELSEKYQTLVTPAGYAFSIWGVIFISQLIWVVAQLLPAYRSKDLVVEGVGYYYVAACAAQILWSIFFAAELVPLSLAAMVSILIVLLVIVRRAASLPAESTGLYFLLKFPFEIHAGWIVAASIVNLNVVLVFMEYSAEVQTLSAYISLGAALAVALYYVLQQTYVLPFVLAWAGVAIKIELSDPKDAITAAFSAETIGVIELAALSLAIGILLACVLRFGYNWRYGKSNTTQGTTDDAYSSIDT